MGEYRLLLASAVGDRDGLGLELYQEAAVNPVAEVFRDDVNGGTSFATEKAVAIPLEVLEWFLRRAGEELAVSPAEDPAEE